MRWRARSIIAACSLVAWLVCARAQAAAFDLNDTQWEGCALFVREIAAAVGPHKVITPQSIPWSTLGRDDALIVIHPRTPLDEESLSAFLRMGGRVAILDDFGAADQNLQRFQITRVPAPSRPVRSLRNNPALAIAEPVSDSANGLALGVHPVVGHVSSVVTNHPAALRHPDLTPVLRISATDEPDGIIAIAGMVGAGRLFVVSDASIIINQMMRYPGNRALAIGLGQYLLSDDDQLGGRDGKLYIVSNGFSESGSLGGGGLSRALVSTMRDVSQLVTQTHDGGVSSTAAMILGAIAALGALGWVAMSAARGYRRTPPRFARPVPLVGQGGVAGRAAVLAAPTTHRALAMLELKSALEEAVAVQFDLKMPLAAPDLLDAVRRSQKLDQHQLASLKKLLFVFGTIETSLAAGSPARVREAELHRAALQVQHVLESIRRGPGEYAPDLRS